MANALVNYSVKDGVALLELSDPPANTYTHEMMKEMDKKMMEKNDWYDAKPLEDIWISPTEQEKITAEETNRIFQKQIEDMMREGKYRPDPIDKLREEMREELNDIKKAIRKIGVMLDGDAPSEEILEKHKTLRDAYRKYKMIEALILGQQE